jgi:iron(III) transport system ATP-binding protein
VTDLRGTIELDGVSKRFGRDVVAVRDLSLRIEPGEIVTVVGPSGCGKTTMLRLIAGFERADAGRIRISGDLVEGDGRSVPPEQRRVGFVFQDYALFPHLTVGANVAFGLRGLRAALRQERIDAMLRLCALEGLASRYPHELSGGQQQRTALARALAPGNGVVLLDEPLSNLDAALRRTVRAELREVLKRAGATALIVTHEQEEALELADRVVVLRNGGLEQVGTPQEIYATPASAFVACFIGESNVVPAVVERDGARTELGVVCCPPCFEAGCPVQVLLRPAQLSIEPDRDAAGVLVNRSYVGTHSTAVIRFPSGLEIRCASDAAEALPPGTRVHVRVRGCPTLVVGGAAAARANPCALHAAATSASASVPGEVAPVFAGLLSGGSAARTR